MKIVRSGCFFQVMVFVLLTNHVFGANQNKDNVLKEIKRNSQSKDSVEAINIISTFKWNVTIRHKNETTTSYSNVRPDTLKTEKQDQYFLHTLIKVDSALLDKLFCIQYKFKGSGLVMINSKVLVAKGYFQKDNVKMESDEMHEGFVDFYFNDTTVKLEMVFLPLMNDIPYFNSLKFCTIKYKENKLEEKSLIEKRMFLTGGFHLAFGIIFIILFLFFRSGIENFYFAVYALLIGINQIFEEAEVPLIVLVFIESTMFIAFEVLMIFMAKILLNKKRNLVFLLLTIVIIPLVLISIEQIHQSDLEKAIPLAFVLGLFFVFEAVSFLYYFIQGFFQKRWEPKTITYGFSITFLLVVAMIIIAILFSKSKDQDYLQILDYMPSLALVSILVTMSVVLGRRNGENHANLMKQLSEIKVLSQQNLEREIEKKQILENQNFELENKVVERTREVIAQKEIIEVKNKEITDNLEVARRIQTSMLPDFSVIRESFKDCFILYKPKDIVSGDFYSFIQMPDTLILACGDCTGHGVSGAFMSMIGSGLLKQVVRDRNLTDPAEILEQLNSEVVNSLRQQSGDSHDGMDMAVCSFDLKNGTLGFSGANRPLWIVRDKILKVINPDKYPVGGDQYSQTESFTRHQVSIQTGDCIYLTTDGFADQFGGPNGKKIMTRQFKEILLAIQNLDMEGQQEHIRQFFEDWKGSNEQVDDVLVIGIRI